MNNDHRSKPHGGSRQAPSQRSRAADPKRGVAFEVLQQVREDDAYANLVLPKLLRQHRIPGRDAAFATELTYGTLRMQGSYDAIIAIASSRPFENIDGDVRDVLRLGVHQLLGMRVADHAAVAETVALARERVGIGASQFVNAVLRTVSERSLDEWLELVAPLTDDNGEALTGEPFRKALAARYSHPLWMIRAFREALIGHGSDPAELEDVLAQHNVPATATFVARPGLVSKDELAQSLDRAGVPFTEGKYAHTALVSDAGSPGQVREVREATAGVQDEGSQFVALALTATESIKDGETWLDLCAGPGGKSALLAAVARENGARLEAVELHEHRAELVRQATKPSEDVVTIRVEDGREVGEYEPEKFDRVLVDAPCTGMGALRRRPEARWRRTPDDLASLAPLQRQLLESAIEATKPGGVVAYVTCSPHLAETQFVVEDVMRAHKDVEQIDAREVLTQISVEPTKREDFGAGPAAQLWPHRHGTDAMFLALLKKKA